MRVRLLNPSIYADLSYTKLHEKDRSPRDPSLYPIVVEGFFDGTKYYENGAIKVGGDELNRVFKSYFSDGRPMNSGYGSADVLGWWNEEGKPKSWEPVGKFDFWNKLKSSREVGETVGKGYL